MIFSFGPVPRQSSLATVRGAIGSMSRHLGQFLKTMGGSTFSSSLKSTTFSFVFMVILRWFINGNKKGRLSKTAF
jgi:hypothetical protein